MSSAPASSSSSSASAAAAASTSSSSSADDNRTQRGGRWRIRSSTFELGEPSSSRQRTMNEALPDSILEHLATQLAFHAFHHHGRLSVASALAHFFQVCSTWREVSRLDHLWRTLTRRIWRRAHPLRDTWRQEYIYWHRTARNFTSSNHSFSFLHFDHSVPPGPGDHRQTLLCRCLALSDRHLACGFADGTVRLFDVETRDHISTFQSNLGHRFGPFSRAVSGIVLSNSTITFARLDGDVYVALINEPNEPPRRAHEGDVVNNGVLVEFAGNSRWWVGLYAGVPGRAFQIWDARSEQVTYFEGSLTDPETVMGWHMLTEVVEPVGRVRVTEREYVVACTNSRLVCFNLRNPGILLLDEGSTTGFVVRTLDARHEAFVVVERSGVAWVRRASTLETLSMFRLRRAWMGGLLGCINLSYVLTYSGVGGGWRVWDVEHPAGSLCCFIPVRAGDANAMVATERHVAISWNDTFIRLSDFGADAAV